MVEYQPVGYTGSSSRQQVVKAQALPEGVDIAAGPRAGDANRNRMLAFLGECYGLGYLPQEEYEARASVAHAAVTKTDLAVLATDLPPLPAPAKPRQRKQWGELVKGQVPRGSLHGLVAALMLALSIAVPTAIGAHHGWEHSAADVFFLGGAIILGATGFLTNLILFCVWVDSN